MLLANITEELGPRQDDVSQRVSSLLPHWSTGRSNWGEGHSTTDMP